MFDEPEAENPFAYFTVKNKETAKCAKDAEKNKNDVFEYTSAVSGSSLFGMGNGVDCLAPAMIREGRWTGLNMPLADIRPDTVFGHIQFLCVEAFVGVLNKNDSILLVFAAKLFHYRRPAISTPKPDDGCATGSLLFAFPQSVFLGGGSG